MQRYVSFPVKESDDVTEIIRFVKLTNICPDCEQEMKPSVMSGFENDITPALFMWICGYCETDEKGRPVYQPKHYMLRFTGNPMPEKYWHTIIEIVKQVRGQTIDSNDFPALLQKLNEKPEIDLAELCLKVNFEHLTLQENMLNENKEA